MSRQLTLLAVLCWVFPAHGRFRPLQQRRWRVPRSQIGIAGQAERYRDVRVRLHSFSNLQVDDARATTFRFDPATNTLHLPSVVSQGHAYSNVSANIGPYDILGVGGVAAGSAQAFPGAAGFGAQATGGDAVGASSR